MEEVDMSLQVGEAVEVAELAQVLERHNQFVFRTPPHLVGIEILEGVVPH